MMHSATVAKRRRTTPRHASLGRWMPVLLSALALVAGGPGAWGLTGTKTTLSTTPAGPTSGEVMTMTANVSSGGNPLTGGIVTFYDTYISPGTTTSVTEVLGTVEVQSAPLGISGTAILQTGVGGIGTHQFKATYGGTSVYATSSSTPQSVTFTGPYSSATALSISTASPYTLTGTVSAFGPVIPTGNVTFTDTTTNATLGAAALGNTTPAAFTANQLIPISNMNNGNTGGTIGPAIGDFNRDGRPDYAVPTNGGPIVILLGNGNGTFTTGTPIYTTSFTPTSAVVGDFNRDGKQDLAVLSSTGTVNIYLGLGDGTFEAPNPPSYPVAPAASTPGSRLLAIGDFNRDGIQDLVATNRNSNNVAVLLGVGDGTFGAPTYFAVGAEPWNVVVGDLNQDGFLDLAVASDSTAYVSVLLGKGNGSFQTSTTFSTTPSTGPAPSQVGSVAIGDFDGDGFPDLATTSAPNNMVYVLLNKGSSSTLGFKAAIPYPMNSGPYYLTIGDFNRDGHLDIISANNGSNNVGVMLNNGDGTFGTAITYSVNGGGIFANAADINGDDRIDLTAVSDTGLNVLLSGQSEVASLSNVHIYGCGAQSITATYDGDVNYAESTSAAQSVTPPAKAATTLTVTVAPSPVIYGQQVSITATLSPYNSGSQTTNGEKVTFKIGTGAAVTVALNNGVAVYNVIAPTNGTFAVTASYAGDCAFAASNGSSSFSVVSPSLTWPPPATIAQGTPLSPTQLDATSNAPGGGNYVYTPASGVVLGPGTSTLSVVFTPTNHAYPVETASVPITVSGGPFIIWPTPTPISYGTPLSDFQLDATATAGTVQVPLYNYYNVYGIYSTGSIYGTGGFDNDGYSYSSSTLGGSVVWNGQTFTLGPPNAPDAVATQPSNPACRGGGCAAGPAMVIPLPTGQYTNLYMLGAMVNNIGASQTFIVNYTDGTKTTYTQNMSDWYNAKGWPGESVVSCSEDRNYSDGTNASTQADSVCLYGYTIPLNASKTVKNVQLPDTRNIVILAMDLGTAEIPGTFVYKPDAGTIEPVGTDTLSVTFTPTNTTLYKTVSASVQLVVLPPVSPIVTTTIEWPTPAPITYGTPLSATQLDALAMGAAKPTPVALQSPAVVAMSSNGVPYNQTGFDLAGGTYSYNKLGNGQVNYAGTTFTLGQPNVPDAISNGAIYTLATPANFSAVYLIGAANITGEINQPFTLSYADGGTVNASVSMSSWNAPAGYGGETVVASTPYKNTQAGGETSGTYDLYGYQIPADPTRTLTSITLPNTPNVVILALGFGTNTQVVVPGSYVYTPGTGVIEPVGTDTLSVSFTPTDPAGYTSATGTTQLVVTQATPILNWPTPAPINVGTALTSTQLDATASFNGQPLPGTFVYTPPAGTSFSTPGTYTLSVTFTPTDTTDFTTATATVQLVVGAGSTGISGKPSYTNCCFFNQPTPYTVTVTGYNSAPAGTVQVVFNGNVLQTGTLSSTSANTSSAFMLVPSGSFYPGNNTVTLQYLGQGSNNPTSSTATIALRNPAITVNSAAVNQTTTTAVPYVFAQAGTINFQYNPEVPNTTEFTDGGSTCVSGKAQTVGTTCNFNVAFAPLLPGLRKGVLQVNFVPAAGSQAEVTLYLFLNGMGDSAQIALSSATQATLNTGLNQPQNMVFNPTDYTNSTLYVANSNASQVDLLPSTGGGLTQWNASHTTLSYPSDLSFDAFDNLVASDSNGAKVYSYSPTNQAQTQVSTTGFTLGLPTQARFDFGGNLYIADAGNTPRIIQVPTEAYAPNQLNLGAQTVSFPQALAVDNAGANLYVGDGNLNEILQVGLNGSGGTTTVSQFPLSPCDGTVTSCAINSPAGFAFDLNGDMYMTDSGQRVLMVPSTHLSNNTPTTMMPLTGLLNPTGITLDGSGNIYVSDVTGFVSKLLVNTGALKFPSVGSTLSTTVTNTGNIPLAITGVTLGNGPNSSFTESDNCTIAPVAPGASCTVNAKYANAGQGFDTITVWSNAFSATGVTIQLSY